MQGHHLRIDSVAGRLFPRLPVRGTRAAIRHCAPDSRGIPACREPLPGGKALRYAAIDKEPTSLTANRVPLCLAGGGFWRSPPLQLALRLLRQCGRRRAVPKRGRSQRSPLAAIPALSASPTHDARPLAEPAAVEVGRFPAAIRGRHWLFQLYMLSV